MASTTVRRQKEVKIVYDIELGDDLIRDRRIIQEDDGRNIAALILKAYKRSNSSEDVILNVAGCDVISAEAIRPIIYVSTKYMQKNKNYIVLKHLDYKLAAHIKLLGAKKYFKRMIFGKKVTDL